MNKGQLVEAVAGQLGSRTAAEDAVDAVLDAMVRAVVAGERVQVTGFGTLEPVQRSARTARNPQTGEPIRVKKTTTPKFRPGQGFKDLVSGAKKLPQQGPSIAKTPKGSLTPSRANATTAKRTTAPTAAKRATATTTTAPAKKTTAKNTAKRTTTATAPAPAKKAPVKKTTTARTPAKKAAPTKPATAAKKTTAPARKTNTTAKKAAPAKRTARRTAA
ncbi:HU family DNA-binding protein [Kitasatospora terrestris]|uniref:DNA-binding protein n=1 Tax=Kitasatospora terrestris TaxID=258051 RepID=A0ABP9ESI8_9ACTN